MSTPTTDALHPDPADNPGVRALKEAFSDMNRPSRMLNAMGLVILSALCEGQAPRERKWDPLMAALRFVYAAGALDMAEVAVEENGQPGPDTCEYALMMLDEGKKHRTAFHNMIEVLMADYPREPTA